MGVRDRPLTAATCIAVPVLPVPPLPPGVVDEVLAGVLSVIVLVTVTIDVAGLLALPLAVLPVLPPLVDDPPHPAIARAETTSAVGIRATLEASFDPRIGR